MEYSKYGLWLNQSDPNCFVLDEVYRDSAAVMTHREAPYFKEYVSRVKVLADRTIFLLDPLGIA